MCYNSPNYAEQGMTMPEKPQKPKTDLKTFLENVNKSQKDKRSGKKIRFDWVNRKRKN